EDRKVAVRDEQRTAQILFHHWAQDEGEQQRRGLASELDEQVADKPKQAHYVDLELQVVHAVRPQCAQNDDHWEKIFVGNKKNFNPHAEQRQVDDQQHEVP